VLAEHKCCWPRAQSGFLALKLHILLKKWMEFFSACYTAEVSPSYMRQHDMATTTWHSFCCRKPPLSMPPHTLAFASMNRTFELPKEGIEAEVMGVIVHDAGSIRTVLGFDRPRLSQACDPGCGMTPKYSADS